MSYQPLARKYRPATFQELVGQDAVSMALGNGIRLGREPRAVIFSGVRGVGKTTVARLYAKALNCGQNSDADPCNACESCLAIGSGVHEDVLEIDGASNTSVDDVRALRETINYLPQRSKYKVYIIDEVHMLSQSAFNALLKTLEEPPKHVVFVFATTELNKVPTTIVSRCQTFYLQKLSVQLIKGRVREILQAEHVDFDDVALTLVAREGRGSMRDALTFLDQAIALGGGQVTADTLQAVLQQAGTKPLMDVLDATVRKDAPAILSGIELLDQNGAEMDEVVERLARLTRDAMVIRELGSKSVQAGMLELDESELALIETFANGAQDFSLNRLFRTLVKCRGDLSGASLDRYILENYLLEWCLDPGLPSIDELLSGKVGGQSRAPQASSRAVPSGRSVSSASQSNETRPTKSSESTHAPTTPPAHQSGGVSLKEAWKAVRNSVDKVTPAMVNHSPSMKSTDEKAQTGPSASSPPVSEELQSFPETWRGMVEAWQKWKPLQARIFEDSLALEYSEQLITIAVDKESLAGRKLLQAETQRKAVDQLKSMFGFKGRFQVVEREHLTEQHQEIANTEETVLATKQRERQEEQARIREELCSDPITVATLREFDGKIEDVTF